MEGVLLTQRSFGKSNTARIKYFSGCRKFDTSLQSLKIGHFQNIIAICCFDSVIRNDPVVSPVFTYSFYFQLRGLD